MCLMLDEETPSLELSSCFENGWMSGGSNTLSASEVMPSGWLLDAWGQGVETTLPRNIDRSFAAPHPVRLTAH